MALVPPVPTVWNGGYISRQLFTNVRPNISGPNNEFYMWFPIEWNNFSNPLAGRANYLFNLGLAPNNPIQNIACIVVDNTTCLYDLHIQFIDGFTLTIPAFQPATVYPVLTSSLQFQVWPELGANVFPGFYGNQINTTNLFVLNANIPPIRIPERQLQETLRGFLSSSAVGPQTAGVVGTAADIATNSSSGAILTGLRGWTTMGCFGGTQFVQIRTFINNTLFDECNILLDAVFNDGTFTGELYNYQALYIPFTKVYFSVNFQGATAPRFGQTTVMATFRNIVGYSPPA
jgi:hypothetical protein